MPGPVGSANTSGIIRLHETQPAVGAEQVNNSRTAPGAAEGFAKVVGQRSNVFVDMIKHVVKSVKEFVTKLLSHTATEDRRVDPGANKWSFSVVSAFDLSNARNGPEPSYRGGNAAQMLKAAQGTGDTTTVVKQWLSEAKLGTIDDVLKFTDESTGGMEQGDVVRAGIGKLLHLQSETMRGGISFQNVGPPAALRDPRGEIVEEEPQGQWERLKDETERNWKSEGLAKGMALNVNGAPVSNAIGVHSQVHPVNILAQTIFDSEGSQDLNSAELERQGSDAWKSGDHEVAAVLFRLSQLIDLADVSNIRKHELVDVDVDDDFIDDDVVIRKPTGDDGESGSGTATRTDGESIKQNVN